MTRRLIASQSSATSGTTQTVTIGAGNDTVAGRTLVLLTEWSGGTSAALNSVVDSKSNTWQSDANRPQPSGGTIGNAVAIWSCRIGTAIVAGDTITITYSGSANTYHNILLYEYDNLASASWKDASAVGTNNTAVTSVASAAVTTGATNEIVVAAIGYGGTSANTATLTSGNSFTDLTSISAVGSSVRCLAAAENTVASASGDGTYSGTLSSAFENVCAVVAYKTTSSVTPGTLTSAWVGAVDATSAVVATKCAGASSIRLKVGTNSGITTGVVYSSSATPDSNGLAKLAITGLSANTQYYWAVEVDSVLDTARQGKVKTFPVAGVAASYSFLFGSCAVSGSNSTVFSTMRTHTGSYGAPLFFQHIGDIHYDNITSNLASDFRTSWDTVLSHSNVAQLLREVPTDYIWSDHDSVGGNNHAGSLGGVSQSGAQTAFRDYVPSYTLPAADNAGVYHAYTVGRVRYIVTDLRSYRSDDSVTDNSSKSMMGSAQKLWFKRELARSEPVKVWVNEVPWVGATTAGEDNWSGFDTERQELVSYITASRLNVIILSGDTHCLAADDGTNSAGGIPVCQAAPFSQTTSLKGGPYSQGSYPASLGSSANQWGWMDVTDSGSTITFAFSGYDATPTAQITLTKTFTIRTREAWGIPA